MDGNNKHGNIGGSVPVDGTAPPMAYPAVANKVDGAVPPSAPPLACPAAANKANGAVPPLAYPAAPTNPYVQMTPAAGSGSMDTVKKLMGRCGRKLEDGTKKATDVAGNVWQHLKTSPSPCDAAMARLAQGTKVLAEGGHDKIFNQAFGTFPGEKLRKAFACYISTTSGPVIGTLYVSTLRLAFCSDNPLNHNSATAGPPEWVYYKVVVQLDQLRAVNPSANNSNPAEKYIQIVTADSHEFWFMGFVNYEKALHVLSESLHR